MAENRYDGASRDELIHTWDQLHGLHNAVLHELLLVTAAMERQGIHTQDGQRSMRSWLQLHAGHGYRTAARLEEGAVKAEELPHLARSFSEGRISFDKFLTCAAFATPKDDDKVAGEAEEGNLHSCEVAARRTREVSPEREDRIRRERHLAMTWAENGTQLNLRGSLPAEEGATVKAAIERIADSFPLFAEDGSLPSKTTRQADALVALAQKTIAEDQDPDRATVVLNVDLDDLVEGSGVGDEGSSGAYSSTVMQRVACDARVQAIIRNALGDAVGIASVLRTVPPPIRRVLMKRDGGCRFPGCTNRCFLDAHHIVEWTKGGRTELPNLALLCRAHHRMLHRRGWSMRGDPNGRLVVVDEKGRPVRAGPTGIEEDIESWLWDDLLQESCGTSEERRELARSN